MKRLLERVWREEREITIFAVLAFFGALILVGVAVFDQTQILGINRWIKPIKFFVSAGIFLGTVGIFLSFLNANSFVKKLISFGTIAAMVVELALISGQAARGTTSHFNVADPFDSAIYSIMGVFVGFNTLLLITLAILYFIRTSELNQVLLWGVRLGIILFVIGSIQGGYMSAQPGHAVGGADGGAGLSFVNWSTEFGDLRVAHFIGLHALQIVPGFAWVADRFLSGSSAIAAVFLFATAYFGFFVFTLIEALSGVSFLGGMFA